MKATYWVLRAHARRQKARGENFEYPIIRNTCRNCHGPQRDERGLYTPTRWLSSKEIGTDPTYADNFRIPIRIKDVPEKDFVGSWVADLLKAVKQSYYQEFNISEQTQFEWEDRLDPVLNPKGRRGPVVWSNTDEARQHEQAQARPLDGAWANGPFLHNGSVATLYDLLSPVSKRPKKFYLGHRDYDMEKLGYVMVEQPDANYPDATSLFDTSKPGNSNAGHDGAEHGTQLSESDRWALLEFLKGYGGGEAQPVVLED